jgi:hypothetical protein
VQGDAGHPGFQTSLEKQMIIGKGENWKVILLKKN